jgi:hypothetical protein
VLLLVAGPIAAQAEGLAAVLTRERLVTLVRARVVLHVADLLEDAAADSARVHSVQSPSDLVPHFLDVVVLLCFPDRTPLMDAARRTDLLCRLDGR